MAYLDVREPFAAAPLASPRPDPAEAAGFRRREWEVIVLAQGDGLASLNPPGRVERLFAWLFGGDHNRRLADPRLEVLRRLAVFAWHQGYAVPQSAIEAFKEAGYSADQLELLLASVSTGRSRLNNGRVSA